MALYDSVRLSPETRSDNFLPPSQSLISILPPDSIVTPSVSLERSETDDRSFRGYPESNLWHRFRSMSYSVMDPGVTRITRSFSLSESRNMPRYDASDHIRSGSRRQGQISLDDLDGPVGWSGSSSLETQEDQTQHRGRRRLLHRRLAREASVTVRDGSDCIPVLLSSSPLASPVLVSPWSPCSTSEGGVMVNKNSNCSGSNTGVHPKLVPHYARDASLKRSLSFGTRSMHIGLDDEDDDRKDKHDDEDYEWNDSIERRLDRGRLAWIPSSAGPTLPLFHDASGRPRRLRRSQSVCGLGFDVEKTLLVPQPRSSIISTTTTPSTPLQATGLSRSLSTSGVPLKTHHSTPPRRQTRHTTLPLTHWSSPKLDHSPTLPPVHTSSEANTVPNTPSSTATPDSPVLVTPDSKDIVDTPRPILSSRTSPRVSLLHTRGCPRPPPSSPPPIAPLPSTPLTDPLGPVAPQRQSRASTVNTSFELTTTTAAAPLSNAEENEEKGHSENNSDQSPRDITDTGNEKSLMSLEQVQRVQAHDHLNTSLHHPFLHHKSNPSVPFSTRSVSTFSTTNPSSHPSSINVITSPQTPFIAPSSNRHSKITAFSGSSSASSTYSASDTSSIAGKFSNFSHGSHHWGFGEKPDISTVFEEEGLYEGEGGCGDDAEVNVDFSNGHKSSSIIQDHLDNQRIKQIALGPALNLSKDLDKAAPRGTSGRLLESPFRQNVIPLSPAPASLPSQQQNGHQHIPSENSTTLFIQSGRPGRSGTISSQASAYSGRSTKSVHPFASAINRAASPPPLPRVTKQSHHISSRGQTATKDSFSMQSQVHLAPAPAHQVTLSSSEDKDDEDICPVCCESLSFTFRLPGEKPHIVPECGHALHEECFSTVYGDVKPGETKRNLGVCGVCRQPMRISEGASYKRRGKDKMAKLMGQNTDSSRGAPPTLASPADIASPSSGSQPEEIDLNADDPLTDPYGMNSSSSRSLLGGDGQPSVVIPSISIKAEHSYISRTYRKGKHAITAVISVKVPSAGDRGRYAARTRPDFAMSRSGSAEDGPQLPPSPRSASSHPTDISSVPASARSLPPLQGPDPFAHVLVDLQNRVVSYHTSGLDALGQLRLFDLLAVRKGTLVREFHVYLFQDAIICIVEERKSTMRKIFSSSSSVRSSDSSHSTHGKGILKMKGRIYVKHVQRITDSSVPGELSLTIEMEDPTMESFILVFRDRGSHETWKRNLNSILEEAKSGRPPPLLNREESNAKVAKLMGIGAPPAPKSASSSRGFASPVSQPSPNAMGGINFDLTPQPSATSYDRSALTPKSPFATSPLAELAFSAPLAPVHTPLDLVIILSLPAPSQTGTLPLKVRLMRQSLQFILAVMGIRDRVALVVCEMGSNGVVRKTPFLNTTRADSRHRLETFVDLLGSGQRDSDEFAVPVGREEKQDVVTAVNTALDVVLQRKVKNPLSGMILISDTSENIKRAQMELVTARLDAANIPVHAIGYGKGHDPSPLWMISNHTHGTYTYVREWYHLRDSLAGIVGSMMSVAMTNMKLHINCQDNEFKVLKVSGASQAIVSTGGKYADVELRELRHGETRELLVEMDFVDGMDEHRYSGDGSDESGGPPIGGGSARGGQLSVQGSIHKSTSIGNLGLALDNLSVADANNMMYEDALIDEIPVTEVDCSYHDPAANRSVTRLAHPILLTTAILPSNAPPSSAPAESLVVRRRMELLASDMITRALLIASRKNFEHAIKILKETKNIIEKISENLQTQLSRAGGSKSRREGQNLQAVHGLSAVGSDLDTLIDALEEHQDMFERDMRNFAAQQAVVLRTQKSWTTRTPSERMYCTPEVQHFVQMSGDWQGGK